MDLKAVNAEQDAAKRIHEQIELHLLAHHSDIMQIVGKWCAFSLEDGRSDGVIYDSKDDAVRIKRSRAKDHCYIQIHAGGIPVKHAVHFLRVSRHPFVNTTDPVEHLNPKLYPRFTNLSPAQKAAAKRQAEIAAEKERERAN